MTDATIPIANSQEKRRLVADLVFLIQVSRPGLWTTTALFYLMPLGHWNNFGSIISWIGLFYVLGPLGLLLYGVNDIGDAEADRYNPRKGTFLFGSLGGSEQLAALRWQIVLAQAPFLILFLFVVGPRILWWLGILLAAVSVYNAPGFGWKGRPPLDVLIQASYLLIFVLSSWLNQVPQLPWQAFVFGTLFAIHSHMFGEVMDIAPDRLAGRRTMATRIGAVPAKLLIATLLSIESALVYVSFGDLLVASFLGVGAVWFLLDAKFLWKNHAYTPSQMRTFMWVWNVASLAGIYWDWANATLSHVKPLSGT
jgi:4-hydroxybenzoate polyprenyltransferase